MGFNGIYPLVMTNIAMEKIAICNGFCPLEMAILKTAMLNYQRVVVFITRTW